MPMMTLGLLMVLEISVAIAIGGAIGAAFRRSRHYRCDLAALSLDGDHSIVGAFLI
jgi:hypothetical protein